MKNYATINLKCSCTLILLYSLSLFILFNQGVSWLPELPQVFARYQYIVHEQMVNDTQFNNTDSVYGFNATQADSVSTGSEPTNGTQLELAGVYTDPVDNISIGFPAYWQVDEIDQNPDDGVRNIAFFYSPESDAYVQLGTEESPFSGTLDSYLDIGINNLENVVENFQLLESATNIDFAGQSGYRFIATYQHNGTNYQRMETGAIIDGRPFFVLYDAEAESYSEYTPLVDLMLESVQVPSQGQGSAQEQLPTQRDLRESSEPITEDGSLDNTLPPEDPLPSGGPSIGGKTR